MAVLIEAISVVFRKESIDDKFPGGWKRFVEEAPNRTLFSDGQIGCVGFMCPDDVGHYVNYLESFGLDFHVGDQTKDIAVVDQIRGFTIPSPWLKFGEQEKDGNVVKACWLAGEHPGFVFTHRGWEFDGSLSEKSGFVANEDVEERLAFLRHEDGLDVYLDRGTGKEMFRGRPKINGPNKQDLYEELKQLCNEILGLELEGEKSRKDKDLETAARVFTRLDDEILPRLEAITSGSARNFAFAHFALGLVFRALMRPENAEGAFKTADELQPDVPDTLLELVRCLGEQGKHVEAVPYARRAVEIVPNSPACLGNLATCLLLSGEKDEAREYLERALDLDPNDPINRQNAKNFE